MTTDSITGLIYNARKQHASDVHIEADSPVSLRIDGNVMNVSEHTITEAEIERFLDTGALDRTARGRLSKVGACSSVYYHPQTGSLRVHAYKQQGLLRLAIRILEPQIPQFDDLGLPSIIRTFAHKQRGLVFVSGPNGHGKTTTVAALINEINEHYAKHIYTIEYPIEYRHKPKKSIFSHQEVGRDITSYAAAIESALQSDPNVIVIAELLNPETKAAALQAAESGYLVFVTSHQSDTTSTIDSFIGSFSTNAQAQARMSVSQSLVAVVNQRLVPKAAGGGRVAATEILLSDATTRNLIREGHTHQLRGAIQADPQSGMVTLEASLNALVAENVISYQDAVNAAAVPDEILNKNGRSAGTYR